jgi:hypothetical protein
LCYLYIFMPYLFSHICNMKKCCNDEKKLSRIFEGFTFYEPLLNMEKIVSGVLCVRICTPR